ncbi:MAG: M23 family metallopeptidase, partial [Clostridia bacterium]|nr:M23 family metallopeptidase [Clostridia bacterium]
NLGFVQTEDLTEPVKTKKKMGVAGKVIIAETAAACLLAAGIFLTNVFVPDTAINTFMGSLTAVKKKEAGYKDFTLTSVVSDLSEADIAVSDEGVIHFTQKATVYPVCDGEVASVTKTDGLYTVKIAHTSKFTSVITGLDTVYTSVGESVKANLPFGYSEGKNEVRVSMYDGDTLLNCYTLSGAVPVWNS